jgi:hypothetical protein
MSVSEPLAQEVHQNIRKNLDFIDTMGKSEPHTSYSVNLEAIKALFPGEE